MTVVDHHRGLDRIRDAIAELHRAGRPDVAESLAEYLAGVRDYAADDPDPAGLRALAYLADRAVIDPRDPRPGDRVRLTYADGSSVTGEWRCEASAEHPHGRPYLLRDDTGERHYHVYGRVRREVLYMTCRPGGFARALADAVTVVRSAWLGAPPALDDDDDPDDNGCDGCAPLGDPLAAVGPICVCAPSCTCDQCQHVRHERRRWCGCGERAAHRVVAWLPVECRLPADPAGLVDPAAPTYLEAQELAERTVCGAICAHKWVRGHRATAAAELGERAAAVWYRVEPWSYTPDPVDLPRALRTARDSAHQLAEYTRDAAEHWHAGRYAGAARRVALARMALSAVLDAVCTMDPTTRDQRTYTGDDPQPVGVDYVRCTGDPRNGFWYDAERDQWCTVNLAYARMLPGAGTWLTWSEVLAGGDVEDAPLPELWPHRAAGGDQ